MKCLDISQARGYLQTTATSAITLKSCLLPFIWKRLEFSPSIKPFPTGVWKKHISLLMGFSYSYYFLVTALIRTGYFLDISYYLENLPPKKYTWHQTLPFIIDDLVMKWILVHTLPHIKFRWQCKFTHIGAVSGPIYLLFIYYTITIVHKGSICLFSFLQNNYKKRKTWFISF